MLISVITACLNSADYVEQAIKSVVEQKYNPVEHIVIDGLSSDGTVDILKKYSHLQWISEKDSGQTNALNKGFKRAKGEIIGWLNADEYYLPQTLQKVERFFLDNPKIDFLYSPIYFINEENKIIGTKAAHKFYYKHLIRLKNIPNQPSVFFKKEVFEKYGFLDEQFHYSMDFEFYCRICDKIGVGIIKEPLGCFRLHQKSKTMTKSVKTKWDSEVQKVQQVYASSLSDRLWIRWYKIRSYLALLLKYRAIRKTLP